MAFDLIIQNGTCVIDERVESADIAILNHKIVEIGKLSSYQAPQIIDAKHLHVLPGIIDSQVHFREPGLTHKEDLESGTHAAVLGGVTSVFEMPNTNPNTVTEKDLQEKLDRAKGRTWCDHGFFIGACKENIHDLARLESLPGCVGIKIFMGSSTGTLLVAEDEVLEKVLRAGHRRIAIHAEDETRLKERKKLIPPHATAVYHPEWRDEESAFLATERIVRIAETVQRKIHLLHVSSKKESEFLKNHKTWVSVETTPQFLTFAAPEIYEKLGTLAQMNPPIRSKEHQRAIWQAVLNGTVDVIATDHAPHTLEEKKLPYPQSPSGMTGVQTLVPIMLNHVHQKRLSLPQWVKLSSTNPAKIYGAKNKGKIAVGFDADFTLVDLNKVKKIENRWIVSKCGWTPYDQMTVTGWPVMTIVRGHLVMKEDQLIGKPVGLPVLFDV